MKEQIKAPEKIQLSDEDSQAIRCRVQNTGNQDAQEMVEYGHKREEKVKARKSEIKGTNSEGKETGTQINCLEKKEEINIQPEQNEEKRFKKMRRG